MLEDVELRAKCVEGARSRVQEFSKEKTAKMTLSVYRSILEGGDSERMP